MSALTAGAIWKARVDFGDGPRDKYFVLLTTCASASDDHLLAFTTSNPDRYRGETSKQCGCPAASCYRIEAGQVSCLPVTTWVQFDNVYRRSPADLQTQEASGATKYLLHLPPDLLFSVLHCAMKSRDLTGERLAMISKTLKRLDEERDRARKAKQATKASVPPARSSPGADTLTIEFLRSELARCGACEADLCDLLGVGVGELASGLAGPVDEKLAADIQAGLELLGDKGIPRA